MLRLSELGGGGALYLLKKGKIAHAELVSPPNDNSFSVVEKWIRKTGSTNNTTSGRAQEYARI